MTEFYIRTENNDNKQRSYPASPVGNNLIILTSPIPSYITETIILLSAKMNERENH